MSVPTVIVPYSLVAGVVLNARPESLSKVVPAVLVTLKPQVGLAAVSEEEVIETRYQVPTTGFRDLLELSVVSNALPFAHVNWPLLAAENSITMSGL